MLKVYGKIGGGSAPLSPLFKQHAFSSIKVKSAQNQGNVKYVKFSQKGSQKMLKNAKNVKNFWKDWRL